jgi:hypothetical protein
MDHRYAPDDPAGGNDSPYPPEVHHDPTSFIPLYSQLTQPNYSIPANWGHPATQLTHPGPGATGLTIQSDSLPQGNYPVQGTNLIELTHSAEQQNLYCVPTAALQVKDLCTTRLPSTWIKDPSGQTC